MMYLEPLQMPNEVTYDKASYSRTYGKFEISPFGPGFAPLWEIHCVGFCLPFKGQQFGS